ncbi:MAG: hypothetical protein LBI13_09955 [Streptococcaceae bacterium]|jgi:flagellar basal body-associated protein FliL|nr:hypothetical protein [Streptococcaceae bacterium]
MMSRFFENGNNCAGNNFSSLFGGGLMMILFLVLIGAVIYFIWHGTSSTSSNSRNFQNPQNFDSGMPLSKMTSEELEAELDKRKATSSLEAEVTALRQELDSLKNKD